MIVRITKTTPNVFGQVVDTILGNTAYLKDAFPNCSNKEELMAEIKKSHEPWSIFVAEQQMAVFTLHLSGLNALLDKFLPATPFSSDRLIPGLRRDLERMKIKSLTVNVPEEVAESLLKEGFEKRRLLLKLAGPVLETNLMPILPLSNPVEKGIPVLAKLMLDSYEKSSEPKLSSVASAEELLRGIMTGTHGLYVPDASFISGAMENAVGACFITMGSPREANVTQLFTHPLYRARGLASTEVATSMNKLFKRGVKILNVWVGESNEVARRLFAKLGFKEARRVVEMVTTIQ